MRKKLLIFMMLLAIAFSFTACGSIDNPFKDTAHVHDFDEWEITKKPTCTEDGVKVRYCSCGDKQTETVVSLGHTPAEAVIENMVKATCTVAGSYDEIIYCNNSNCNEKINTVSKVIDATGHSFGEWITVKAPTSTEDGLKERTCQCGEKQTETIKMTAAKLEFELNSDGVSYSIIGIGDFTDTELVIPDTYNGYPVTVVRSYAFQGNSFITSVTTGGNIKSIEAYAFESCSSLKTVIFSDSLERIGEHAFSSCHKLEDLIIGKSFEFFPLTAFYYCFAMSNIEVDEKNPYFCSIDGNCYDKSVTTLIRYSPGKADQSFVVPESVTNIGPYALTDAQNLISVVIPNGVKSISDFAFYYCNNLTSIVIPNSVSNIGVQAFGSCSAITEVYYIGDKEEWEIIGFGYGNSYLTGATCYFYSEDPPMVEGKFWHYVDGAPTAWLEYVKPKYSEGLVFRSNGDGTCDLDSVGTCSDEHIIIPPTSPDGDIVISIGAIGSYVFGNSQYRDKIISITIPDTVSYIHDGTFWKCTNLSKIIVSDDNPYFVTIEGSLYSKDVTKLIRYIPSIAAPFILPKTITRIHSNAFSASDSLTTIFYLGNESDWANVIGPVSGKTVYFYSEEEPTVGGKFWHYVGSSPAVWWI